MSTCTPSCMLCGSLCRERAFCIQSNDDDPDSVLEDIQRLDKAIHRLHVLQSQRRRQLNVIYSSTRTLPNEILLSIFHFFLLLPKSRGFPQFILGGVCSRWRNLVINESRFWRSMNLIVERQTISKSISLLEVFKERNAMSFDSIQLKFKDLPTNQFLSSIREVSTLSRIALYDPPFNLLRIANDDLNTHDVSLIGPSSYYRALGSVGSIPGLSQPWSTLTILKLSLVQIDICCELLLGCPNLVVFWSYNPMRPTTAHIQPNTYHAREIHFPHLQQLTWHHEFSEWDNNFLSFYRFPTLQYFRWHGDDHYHSIELFHDFISLLPPTCLALHLSAYENGEPDLDEPILLSITHPIEQLICSHFDMYTLVIVLEKLQDPTFIPLLTFFKWEHCQDSHWTFRERMVEFARLFRDVLWARKGIFGVGRRRFRMEIGGMWSPSWSKPGGLDKKTVREIVEGDWFTFEIAEDGNFIMYF